MLFSSLGFIHNSQIISLDEGADPNSQDTYGNTVLHMGVIVEQLGRLGSHFRALPCQACSGTP